MLDNLLQFLNIGYLYDPALVQFSAFHITCVSPLQFSNAEEPIEVTLSGIVTLVNEL